MRYIFKPNIWKYKTNLNAGKLKGSTIQAVAFDLPGNTGVGEIAV